LIAIRRRLPLARPSAIPVSVLVHRAFGELAEAAARRVLARLMGFCLM
jgi:hypothetical protein